MPFNTIKNNFLPEKGLMEWLHLLGWVLVFSMSWGAFIRLMPIADSLWRASINTIGLGLMFYGSSWLYHRFYEQKQHLAFAATTIILLSGMTVLRFVINMGFEYEVESTLYEQGETAFFVGVAFTNILAWLISFLYENIKLKKGLEKQKVLLQNEQRAAKLQFLRAQMNPHFLFNTLNNIYSLAVVRSEKTAPLVMRLSELLKYVIYDSQDGRVAVTNEVELLEDYIDLFQLQQETPQDVKLTVEGNLDGVNIEPLLLVPIVENCFKHCDFAENNQAYTHLHINYKNGTIVFKARNSYNPDQQQKDVVGGVGLPNIRRRLELEYPDQHQLDISSKSGHYELSMTIELE